MDALDPKIVSASSEFESWYAQLQSHFEVLSLPTNQLVTGVDNRQRPIHRWYSLKEGYSGQLPEWAVSFLHDNYGANIHRVIDPFIGGGTTGVSLAQLGISVDGLEYNPFIHLVAKTKSHYSLLTRHQVQLAIEEIHLDAPGIALTLPNLGTLSNEKYFRPSDIQLMLNVIQQIGQLDIDSPIKDFLLVGVAASIDEVAHLRKDGRALRYEQKPARLPVDDVIRRKWSQMVDDLEQHEYIGEFRVSHGSAENLTCVAKSDSYDLALYSPPYLNNFDYSEIYKLELWLLGHVKNGDEWRSLRKGTIRSHPSIQFDKQQVFSNSPEMADLHEKLELMRDTTLLLGEKNATRKIIVGYFEDMFLAIREQWRVLKPGGYLIYVVANSRHHYLPIATDVILGEIARRVGFNPLRLVILKQRNGRTRQKAYLRESAVILQKPLS